VFTLGVIFGSIVASVFLLLKKTYGTLKIDRSNPEKELYRIELGDLDSLSKKKRISLKIDNNADLSQK
jgi:hypothetical protein